MMQQGSSEFHPTFLDKNHKLDYSPVGNNGFILKNMYLPEEVLLHILSHLDPKELLNYSLVCHNWKRIIRSNRLWFMIYERKYKRTPKKLPWYLYYALLGTNYFDTNLLMNKNQVEQWNRSYPFPMIIRFESEDVINFDKSARKLFVLEIRARQTVQFRGWCGNGRVYYELQWLIKLGKNKLLKHILDVYKPHISLTKWGSMYDLHHGNLKIDEIKCDVQECVASKTIGEPYFTQWLDLVITEYSKGIEGIFLEQVYCNQDTRYAHKGCVKFLFDSIQPIDDDNDLKNSKPFSNFEFISEIHPLGDP